MGTSSEQHYSLRWNDYSVKIVTAFQSLRDEEDFVDVTLACDGHHYSAHKMVLSACSPYFRTLLKANPCQHPIVILKDVGHIEMERLLEFMYNGEVNIAQDALAAFLKTAETLKIRGLAGSSAEDLDGSQIRDVHTFLSGGAATIGTISGRNSPLGYSSSQDNKDEDISLTADGLFHTSTPSVKRRKKGLGGIHAEGSSHPTDITGDSILDANGERVVNISGGEHGLEIDDRRELKAEPTDGLGGAADVYADSDLTGDQSLAGPSGSLTPDGLTVSQNADFLLHHSSDTAADDFPSHLHHNNSSNVDWSRLRVPPPSSSDNQCVVCLKSFSNRGSMTRHLRDQHLQPGATVTCDICGKVCKNRNCLITHRSVTHSIRKRVKTTFDNASPPSLPQENGAGVGSFEVSSLCKIVDVRHALPEQNTI